MNNALQQKVLKVVEQAEKNKQIFESLKQKVKQAYDRGKINRRDTTSTVLEDTEEDNLTVMSGGK